MKYSDFKDYQIKYFVIIKYCMSIEIKNIKIEKIIMFICGVKK